MPTQNEYAVALQSQRSEHIKINLLNFNYQVVDELSGVVTNSNISINADSDIRRTCDITMVVTDSSFNVALGGKIWLDKSIQIFTGIESMRTGEIVWTNRGIYLINSPSFSYGADTHSLSFQGVDLMAKLTGMRNGYIEGAPTVVPQGSKIRDVMIATLKLGGFTKYIVEDNPQTTPYEINVAQGGTLYDLLKQLKDISAEYEMFFDVDGVFRYQKIPTGQDEIVVARDDLWEQVLINYSLNTDFTTIKNSVEVYGKSHKPIYFGGDATVSGNQYSVNIATFPSSYPVTSTTIGFVAKTKVSNPTFKINNLVAYPIVNEDGSPAIIPEANKYYVLRYKDKKFIFLGYQQIYGKAMDENPDSPFYIDGTIGIINIQLLGGEYENIYTNDLAVQRARYELYIRTNRQDAITMTCVPLPWLDVNTLVEFTLPNETEKKLWMIKNINTSQGVGDTQSIQMIRYYPLYPIL